MIARPLSLVLLALCFAVLAAAQEQQGTRRKRPKIGPKYEGLEPQTPGEAGLPEAPQEPKPSTDEPEPAPKNRGELSRLLPPETPRETWEASFLINGLRTWPDDLARDNADILVSRGERELPLLRQSFREIEMPRVRAAIAEILGRLRDDESYNALARALETRSGHEHPTVYFRALFLIDRRRAIPDVTRLLEHRITALRNAAEAFLNENLRREEIEEVERYLQSRKMSVRLRALDVLASVAPIESIDHFIAGLGDDQAPVAQFCLERLAEVSDPDVIQRLVAEARSYPSRRGSYATLVLVLREERHGEELLQPSDLPRYAPSLLRADPLEAGVAAVVSATLGYRSELPDKPEEWLNHDVPTALIAALAVRGYYRDYGALAPLIASRLTLLSGQTFGRDVRAWVEWWEREHTRFRARRRLFSVAEKDYPNLVLYYYRGGEGSDGRPNNLLFRGLELQDAPGVTGEIILSQDQMKSLIERLEEHHLFERAAAREARSGSFRELRLQLFNLERTWVFPEPLDAAIADLEVALLEKSDENRWQRYWNPDSQPSFRAFIESNQEWWDQPQSELDQQRKLKEMILAAYEHLETDAEKLAALDELDRLLADSRVAESGDALSILFRIRDETHPDRLIRWVDIICRTPESMVFEPLTTYLARLPKGASRPLLDKVLAAYPAEPVRRLLASDREALRQAAAAALWRFPDEETQQLLLDLLDDDDSGVRRGAALSLGQLRAPEALDVLERRLPLAAPFEREAICEALGRIGGERARQLLAQASLTGTVEDRMAAIHGLGLLPPEMGSDPLVDAYVINAETGAGQLAERLLRNRDDARSSARLHEQLTADSFPARRAAALLLGRRGEPVAIPVLVECDQRSSQTDSQVREVLTGLTAYEPLVEGASYSLWWSANRQKHPAEWVLDALRRENVDVETDLPIRLDGKVNPRIVEVLLVAAEHEWKPLRSLASRTLAELLQAPEPATLEPGPEGEALREYWDAVWLRHPDRNL